MKKTKLKLKKKVVIIPLVLLILVFLCMGTYGFCLKSVSNSNEPVTFTVGAGTSKIEIANNLKTAGLVRSKYAVILYLFFNSDLNLQAGNYELNRNMNAQEMIEKMHKGDVKIDTVTFTFVEGKNVNDFIALLAEYFSFTEQEIKDVLTDHNFINELIAKYDFLTDEVLNGNIYYALEGYLFPDTYQVRENASVKEIITMILDNTQVKLNSLDFTGTDHSIHEILTMASIVELEAVNSTDRAMVAQVIYKRLEMGKGIGSDITTYYAVKKNLGEPLTMSDLRTVNPYNTSESNFSMAGKLPVGPVGNPSLMSINAVLNPSDTEYVYFVANTCTGEIFFNVSDVDHMNKANELRKECATN